MTVFRALPWWLLLMAFLSHKAWGESEWEHITFADVDPTAMEFSGKVWNFEVKNSSSAMVQAFKKVATVNRVVFEWSSTGKLSHLDLQEKSGDDAVLRVGFALAGDAPLVPFFAPAWIKALRDHLHHESDRLVYLIPGMGRHLPDIFKSPYSDSIQVIRVESTPLANEPSWNRVEFSFPTPVKVVGLWLMADGDNSKHSFTTKMRRFTIE